MLRIFFLLAFICVANLLFAQANVYHPFPLSQNTEWRTDYFSIDCIDLNYSLCASSNYYTEGDTVINNLKYSKIYLEGIGYTSDSITYLVHGLQGFIREDTLNKKIYFMENGLSFELLIYNFNLELGDTLDIFLAANVVVTSIDSMLIGNNYHRRINFENSFPHPIFVVEGMGSNGGLFTELYDGFGFEAVEVLKCFQTNDTTLYEDSSYNFTECDLSIPTAINEIPLLPLSVFPNPALLNQRLNISGRLPIGCTYSIYNVLGDRLMLNSVYDPSEGIYLTSELFSPGVYFLRIFNNDSTPSFVRFIIQ